MKFTATVFGALLIALATLTAPATAQYKLTVNCSGFNNYVGKNLYIRVTKVTIEAANVRQAITAAAQDFVLLCLEDTSTYRVDVFVDANGNGRYDGPTTDPSWRKNVVVSSGMDKVVSLMFPSEATNVEYPNTTPPSVISQTFQGYWYNRTFSTTGPATANVARDAQLGTCAGSITVSGGAFGQPNPTSPLLAPAPTLAISAPAR